MKTLKPVSPEQLRTVDDVERTLALLGGVEYFEEAIATSVVNWRRNCHSVSLAFVRTGLFGPRARVARGFVRGVASQHSWVCLSGDCYDRHAPILDPTLWSYRPGVAKLQVTKLGGKFGHRPHGAGSIFGWGRPSEPERPPIHLTPTESLSVEALDFLDMLGPLDYRGWAILSTAPVEDWPAGEIYAAMDDTRQLKGLVPIDKLGMLTDRNPGEMYR